MSSYLELIEGSRLIESVETCSTTGDVDYPGTAVEVTDKDGMDLFHIVVDGEGRRQVLFFAVQENYRVPFEALERCLAKARDVVMPK